MCVYQNTFAAREQYVRKRIEHSKAVKYYLTGATTFQLDSQESGIHHRAVRYSLDNIISPYHSMMVLCRRIIC